MKLADFLYIKDAPTSSRRGAIIGLRRGVSAFSQKQCESNKRKRDKNAFLLWGARGRCGILKMVLLNLANGRIGTHKKSPDGHCDRLNKYARKIPIKEKLPRVLPERALPKQKQANVPQPSVQVATRHVSVRLAAARAGQGRCTG